MSYLLIVISALGFWGLHKLNSVLFEFLTYNDHISLIYLPAFLRLINVLILGPLNGSIATLLGGIFLLPFQFNLNLVEIADVFCSTSGPLIALGVFKLSFNREIKLTSSHDLLILSLIYSFANAMLHHLTWCLLDPNELTVPVQFFEMIFGDFAGAVVGALIMKWAVKLPFIQKRLDL